MSWLRRLGPHPVLIVRYVTHQLLRRRRLRRLRSSYSRTIADPRPGATPRLFAVELPAADALPPELVTAAERLRLEADAVLEHKVDYLGSGPTSLGPEIDWHLDFKSGYRWPVAFYQDVEVTRLTDDSDAKVPWELSRGHQLLTLARAARLYGDERYALELERQLDWWIASNPPGRGINWVNAMEVAIRAVNWIWALAIVGGVRPLDEAVRARVTRSLQVHGRHIAANLEGTPHLRSNHFLADVLGLLVLGATIEGDPAAGGWFRLAHRAFEREIVEQVHDDGVGFEASLPYHGLALEMFLLAKVVADRARSPFSDRFERSLRRMIVASRALRHSAGRLPQLGDGDSGRILPAGFERPPTLDHLLWLGAAVIGDERPLPTSPDAELAWTLGVDAWRAAAALPAAPPPRRAAFPQGGYFVLRDRDVQAFVRCGDIGQNGNGGHAHNDLLSFELSYRLPLVVDSGTYVYTSDPAARNAFRSTAAHNTVSVAGHEINPIVESELFRLRQVAHPRVELWEELEEVVRLRASHDGYRRLAVPVVHRRTFELVRQPASLVVRDELLGSGASDAESFVHLAPESTVTKLAAGVFRLKRGDVSVSLAFAGVDYVSVTEGWVSDRFGVREAAPVLVAHVSGVLPLAFGYEFTFGQDERPKLEPGGHAPSS